MLEIRPIHRILAEHTQQLREIQASLARIETALQFSIQKEFTIMAALDDAITALNTATANETTVSESADTAFAGIPKLISDAVAAALAAGATPAQLKSVTDAAAAIQANSDKLAAAILANTGPSPGPVTPGTPVTA